jgi:glycosyltransferase involved in cell wall biosynthesis
MDRSRLAIIIPAFNEAATVAELIDLAKIYGTPIIVDDGSSDATADKARVAGAVVVPHSINMGYDAALNSGFAYAVKSGFNWVITLDADGQHDPSLLPDFIDKLEIGADVVIGVRDKQQRFAEHIFAWIARAIWGIRDPLCGLKGYRIDVYIELGHFDSYESIGTELAIFAAKNKKKIEQIQFNTRTRIDLPRFGTSFITNLKILRACLYAISQ